MTKKRVMLVVGILVSVAGLIWALWGVDFSEVRDYFTKPRFYLLCIPFVFISLFSMAFRSIRTYYLLRHEAKLGQWRLYKITMIGFCYNSILPARAGEFFRVYLLGKEKGLGYSRAAASLVVERLFDFLTILICFVVALMWVDIPADAEVSVPGVSEPLKGSQIQPLAYKLVILAVVLFLGIIAMMIGPLRRFGMTIIRSVPLVPNWLKERVCGAIEHFTSGLGSLRDPATVFWVLLHSFLVWLTVSFSVWVIQFGFDDLRFSLGAAFVYTIIVCFAVMIPSGPSYFGMYEAGGILALMILGVVTEEQKSLAFSYTLAVHLLQIIPIIVLGLIFAFMDHVSVGKIQREAAKESAAG